MSPVKAGEGEWPTEVGELKAALVAWLEFNEPAGLTELADWLSPLIPSGRNDDLADIAAARSSRTYAEWEAALLAAGLICPSWPREYGGSGMGPLQVSVVEELFAAHGLPRVRRGMGETLVGPAVLQHGTPEQRDAFLPRIVQGIDLYCQGFSEPEAGSDLASLRTKGVIDGDEVVITGHKTWTTSGDEANTMFVLCRTDAASLRHRGLSYVLVPIADNNISVQPIRQMTGAAEFSEEYLDGARAPLFNVIGGLGNGWRVAMTTLDHERSFRAATQHLAYHRQFDELVQLARRRGLLEDPVRRQELASAFIRIELIRYGGARMRAEMALGNDLGSWASTSKLMWSEFHQKLGELFLDYAGPEGLVRPDGSEYRTTRGQDIFLASRAGTIYSGTSEIQRNIIAEKILGMPR